MILDQRKNALCYLGISPTLDKALHFLSAMEPQQLSAGAKVELDGSKAFYSVAEVPLQQKPMNFEYHQKYIDIHVPVTGAETIALCSASSRPADADFAPEKDIGFFEGSPVNTVCVPAGWFCLCFPDDAHVPGIGEDGHAIMKVIVKIQA